MTGEDAASRRPRVVAGVDGSVGSREALLRGLLAAARRGADLDVVTAYGSARDRGVAQSRARTVLAPVQDAMAVSGVRGVRDVGIRQHVVEGAPARVLVERSRQADLLVVGSRGRSGTRALLGSVALHCVTRAACPVLVVHRPIAVSPRPRIVVGLDSSAGSRAALAAAVEEAARMAGELEVVTAYAVEDHWAALSGVPLPAEEIHRELRSRARQTVDDLLADRGAAAPPAAVVVAVAQGPAGDVLVDRSRTADVLVVGSTGHNSLTGLLLGSVALHCAMHATGPVLVVHPPGPRAHGATPPTVAAAGPTAT